MTRRNVFIALVATLASSSQAPVIAQNPEILRPEAAFPYELVATEDTLALRFSLPEGYYLYRDKFGFASLTDAVDLGREDFPPGLIHEDEYFGRQEVYRGKFEIGLPYARSAPADSMELELKLQGCADIGLCYPPQTWSRGVNLPATAPLAATASNLLFGVANSQPLAPEDAFVMNARFDGPNELVVSFQIEPGYYLYQDKFEFAVDGGIGLGTAALPPGVDVADQTFGDVQVYYDYVEIEVPFSRSGPNELAVELTAGFQGCQDDSICYPPMSASMALVLPATSEFGAAELGSGSADAPEPMVSEQAALAEIIVNGSWPALLGVFFGAGLLLAFTPCVLPMVPILSSIIAGDASGGSTSAGRGFTLSLAYVLGMAVTYTAAGALAAMAGEQVQAIFQKPWIIVSFAGLFGLLSLGMFGVYDLQMPTAVQSRLASLANRQKAGTFAGTAVMGALSALIVTACVAPALIATLAVMGQTGDVARGASALFALSLGMGAPLLIVGASAGSLLPKAGPWMNVVKATFGVMMLGIAIWMLERVLPGNVTLLLWALLVFLSGVFLGAFEPLPESPHAMKRLSKGVGVLACLYGALLLIGAVIGGDDPLRPIPDGRFAAASPSDDGDFVGLEFREIETLAALETALAEARRGGQPVMVDFTADWCVSCREMEERTFPDARVVGALSSFMLLRADVTANNDDDQALLKYFDSFGPPTIAFFDSQGARREPYTLVGYVEPADFATHVERVAAL
jgi:thiol:disulfide interchange protein DsbD